MRLMLLSALLCLPSAAQDGEPTPVAQLQGIEEYALPNGLRVVLFPDATKPTFTVNLTVFVGSIHEGAGEAGMAHVFEHLLFHALEGFPDVPETLKNLGADYNGTTALERTNYFETLNATEENLETAIKLEAARLSRAVLRAEDLEKEGKVVESEFEIGANNPQGLLFKAVMGAMYDFHAYARAPIGTIEDFRALRIDSIRAFYKRYYRPDNAALFLTGKFDRAKALALVEKHFGVIQGTGEGRPLYTTREPAVRGERRVTVRKSGESYFVMVAYRIPGAASPDSVTASLLAQMLASDNTGPLHDALVGKGLAASIGVGSYDLRTASPYFAFAMVPKDKDPDAAESTIVEFLEKKIDTLTPADLDRAKSVIERACDEVMNDPQALGTLLSDCEAAGSWKLPIAQRELAKRITMEEVKAFAAKYLRRENRVVGRFEPDDQAVAVLPEKEPGIEHYAELLAKVPATVKAVKEFSYEPEALQAAVRWVDVGPAKVGVISKEVRGDDVHIQIHIPLGGRAAVKPAVSAGEALAALLTERTQDMDKAQTSRKFAEWKSEVGVSIDLEHAGVSIRAKRGVLKEVLDLVTRMLRAPTITEDQLKEHMTRTEGELKAWRDDPMKLVRDEIGKMLFPERDFRRPRTMDKRFEDLRKLTLDALARFHGEFLGAEGMLVGVVGEVDVDEVKGLLEPLVRDWKAVRPFKVEPDDGVDQVTARSARVTTPGKPAATSLLLQPIRMSIASSEFPALDAATWALFQEPLASRIPKRVREQEALSYATMGQLVGQMHGDLGIVLVFSQTKPEQAEKAIGLIREELERALKEGITGEELEAYKKSYRNRMVQQRSHDGVLALMIPEMERAGLDFGLWARQDEGVSRLTLDEVNAALRKYVKPDQAGLIQVGDFQ
ncbi:MAG: insulinase family protein [Planctomycetes bacterium]|nr:insulinase family protein [Planctomycetota bacterium]